MSEDVEAGHLARCSTHWRHPPVCSECARTESTLSPAAANGNQGAYVVSPPQPRLPAVEPAECQHAGSRTPDHRRGSTASLTDCNDSRPLHPGPRTRPCGGAADNDLERYAACDGQPVVRISQWPRVWRCQVQRHRWRPEAKPKRPQVGFVIVRVERVLITVPVDRSAGRLASVERGQGFVCGRYSGFFKPGGGLFERQRSTSLEQGDQEQAVVVRVWAGAGVLDPRTRTGASVLSATARPPICQTSLRRPEAYLWRRLEINVW